MERPEKNENTSRRKFIKASALSMLFFSIMNRVIGKNMVDNTPEFASKPFEEMRPGEIQQAIKKMSYAFVPVSPMIEWHSFHLPMGTDGLISESICRIMSEKVGGVWFRPLSLGLDSWRSEDLKKMWGFKSEEKVFGMDFPDIPLTSEYCQIEEMKKVITNRVNTLKKIGIKHIFLLNHHGGKDQIPTIKELGEKLSDGTTKVHGLKTYQFNNLTRNDEFFGVGGHAGYSETTWLMAYRPELIDLTQQSPGELSVRKTGILHNKPIIEEEWNPRNVSFVVANKLRERVTANFTAFIDKLN